MYKAAYKGPHPLIPFAPRGYGPSLTPCGGRNLWHAAVEKTGKKWRRLIGDKWRRLIGEKWRRLEKLEKAGEMW
jgi:hypothetical protein